MKHSCELLTSFRTRCWVTQHVASDTSIHFVMNTSSIETGPPSTPSFTIIKAAADYGDPLTCHLTSSQKRSSSTSWESWRLTSSGRTRGSSRKRKSLCHRTNSREMSGYFSSTRNRRRQRESSPSSPLSSFCYPSSSSVSRRCLNSSITKCSTPPRTVPRSKKTRYRT